MQQLRHDGRATAYRQTSFGEGPRTLYVHGAGGSHRTWVAQYGDREGPPAVALDLSGHGESDDVAVGADDALGAYADDVVAVARETDARVLVGHSMGGAVALRTVLDRDHAFEALVLADTGAKLSVHPDLLDRLDSDFEGAVAFLARSGVLFHDADEELVGRTEDLFHAAGQAVLARDFRACDRYDVRDRLDEVTLPTLAVCGEHDGMTPPAYHEFLADELADCTYRQLADAGHMAMQERPEAFGEAVREFLDARVD